MLMYQTLDGDWTCEPCTLRQCDGEIPLDVVNDHNGEPCCLCERTIADEIARRCVGFGDSPGWGTFPAACRARFAAEVRAEYAAGARF